MLFLVWYDEDPKKTTPEKIAAAVGAYRTRFSVDPKLVLVNVRDYVDIDGLLVRSEGTVQPNTFWVGLEDGVAEAAAAATAAAQRS